MAPCCEVPDCDILLSLRTRTFLCKRHWRRLNSYGSVDGLNPPIPLESSPGRGAAFVEEVKRASGNERDERGQLTEESFRNLAAWLDRRHGRFPE